MREPFFWLVLIVLATVIGFVFAYISAKRKRNKRKTLAKNLIKEDRYSRILTEMVEEDKKEISDTSSK
jgi:p-aminobenzoyl-glutamate transporter AbgT